MIIRIVRMHFTETGTAEFLEIFARHKMAIRNFHGCLHLELLKDNEDPTSFTTLSHWDNIASLNAYRNSPLFDEVWGRTKSLFAKRPQAFSLVKYLEVKL